MALVNFREIVSLLAICRSLARKAHFLFYFEISFKKIKYLENHFHFGDSRIEIFKNKLHIDRFQ
jgi:hypothetical protein